MEGVKVFTAERVEAVAVRSEKKAVLS